MTVTFRDVWRPLAWTARRAVRTVAFASVVVATWRAPVPWLHQHSESDQPDGATPLPIHLASWHADGDAEPNDVHLHFAMLEDILRGGGCPVPPTEDEERPVSTFTHQLTTASQSSVTSVSMWTGAGNSQISGLTVDRIGIDGESRHALCSQFLSHFAVARALQSLLSIALC